jgi:tetratricopeptide (TPR) repeat protein
VLSMLLFFSFFTKSTWSALALAALFLTAFSYFVLHFYFQAKKPQQFLELRHDFFEKTTASLSQEKGSAEYHLSLSHAFIQLSDLLNDKEATYYPLPQNFKTLAPLLEKFSIWVHWKDVHKMKELLLLSGINETVALVKLMPTDLEAHANLASAYLALSRIYMDPRKANPHSPLLWTSPEYSSKQMQDKFHAASDRAIEELKILNDYAPTDPWIHAQLAQIYHDKGLAELEIKEYETLLKIRPSDKEVLFRLGVLYFEQGHNSHGLKIYEQLKGSKEEMAEELIGHYDSFQFHDLTIASLSS